MELKAMKWRLKVAQPFVDVLAGDLVEQIQTLKAQVETKDQEIADLRACLQEAQQKLVIQEDEARAQSSPSPSQPSLRGLGLNGHDEAELIRQELMQAYRSESEQRRPWWRFWGRP